jgi:hypothetical protein
MIPFTMISPWTFHFVRQRDSVEERVRQQADKHSRKIAVKDQAKDCRNCFTE